MKAIPLLQLIIEQDELKGPDFPVFKLLLPDVIMGAEAPIIQAEDNRRYQRG